MNQQDQKSGKQPTIQIPNLPLVGLRLQIAIVLANSGLGMFQGLNVLELYVVILLLALNLCQIQISATKNNQLKITEVIGLNSTNYFIKYMTGSHFGKHFSNIFACINNFAMLTKEEAENIDNYILSNLQSGPADKKKINRNLIGVNPELKATAIRDEARSIAGFLQMNPMYQSDKFAKGLRIPILNVTPQNIWDNYIDPEIKSFVNWDKCLDFIQNIEVPSCFYDGINIFPGVTDDASNLTSLEYGLNFGFTRLVNPQGIGMFEDQPLDPDSPGISEIEKIRRTSVSAEKERKLPKKNKKK